jgi:hypothetical protein
MTRHFKAVVFCMGLAIPLLTWPSPAVAETRQITPAPRPAQILAAKRVFVGNAGGDEPFYDGPLFNGGPDRPYNQLYAAVKGAGRYELVGAPGDADLLVEIRFTTPTRLVPPAEKNEARDETIFGAAPYDPQLRLEIRDPKTNALLWAFTEHVQWAILQGNRDKNFDQAMARILTDVQGLSVSADKSSKP